MRSSARNSDAAVTGVTAYGGVTETIKKLQEDLVEAERAEAVQLIAMLRTVKAQVAAARSGQQLDQAGIAYTPRYYDASLASGTR